jgi:hypothetical protein
MRRVPSLFLTLIGLLVAGGVPTAAAAAEGEAAAEELPPGVEQILPRGRIAAVIDPQFVTAAEAELPDDAWVLGVVVDGVAKAYSLNLLNRHEVVNDRTGETAYAAVW